MGVSTTDFVVLDLETLQTVEVRTIKIDDGTFMDKTELQKLGIGRKLSSYVQLDSIYISVRQAIIHTFEDESDPGDLKGEDNVKSEAVGEMDVDFEHILDGVMKNGEDHEDTVMSEPMSGKFSSLNLWIYRILSHSR